MDEIEEKDDSDDRVFFRVARQRVPAPGPRGKKGKKKANQTNDKAKQKTSPRSKALGDLKSSYEFDLPTRSAPDKESKREDDEELMSRQKALSLGTKKHLPCKPHRVNGHCPLRSTCPYAHTKAPLPPCQKYLMVIFPFIKCSCSITYFSRINAKMVKIAIFPTLPKTGMEPISLLTVRLRLEL